MHYSRIDNLPAAVDRWRRGRHVARLVDDILVVAEGKRLHILGTLPHAVAHFAARLDHDHVRAHLTDFPLDAPLGTLANRQHSDDRCDADDNTEHREEAAQLVICQCTHGNLE